ncbi:MAG: pitrilysin family protein, partial [Planctomycetota bacterium]
MPLPPHVLPLQLGLLASPADPFFSPQDAQAGPEDAGEPPLDPARFGPLPGRVQRFELANGWRFLVLPRPEAPVVSFETYVPVGSADETAGATGLAHFFEHLAFKGSDRIGTIDAEAEERALERVDALASRLAQLRSKAASESELREAQEAFNRARTEAGAFVREGEFSALLEQAGGARTLNATTSVDETRYVVSLPRNHVETWCWLESERFLRPVLREFYTEREAVLEERRARIDEAPFGRLLEVLGREAFGLGPYGHPALGAAGDVLTLTRPQAENFFRVHYSPERMVTAIVGDVDPDQLLPMLERYFGRVPRHSPAVARASEAAYHDPLSSRPENRAAKRAA